ncbi:hypothetical protein FV219_12290 [Methylobacterium sp. WL122]|nr:hypothetical protein FV219_12290 [Methylobacterium sp. WL122]
MGRRRARTGTACSRKGADRSGSRSSRPSSRRAAIRPPPQVGAGERRDFDTYRAAASHKAFAVSAGSAYAWQTAQGTKAAAIEAELHRCESSAGGKPCRLYAVDDAYAAE